MKWDPDDPGFQFVCDKAVHAWNIHKLPILHEMATTYIKCFMGTAHFWYAWPVDSHFTWSELGYEKLRFDSLL